MRIRARGGLLQLKIPTAACLHDFEQDSCRMRRQRVEADMLVIERPQHRVEECLYSGDVAVLRDEQRAEDGLNHVRENLAQEVS